MHIISAPLLLSQTCSWWMVELVNLEYEQTWRSFWRDSVTGPSGMKAHTSLWTIMWTRQSIESSMGCDSVVLEDFFHSFSVYRCKVLNLKSKYSYVNCQKTLCYACGHFSFCFLFLFPLRAPLQLHQVSAGQIEPPAPTCSRLLSQCVTGISFPLSSGFWPTLLSQAEELRVP